MNDEEFEAKLACLNALYGGTLLGEGIWKSVRAAKEHTDHFGDNISRGEIYYKRDILGSYDVFKVSKDSMLRMLELLFYDNPSLLIFAEGLRDEIKERKGNALREAAKVFEKPKPEN